MYIPKQFVQEDETQLKALVANYPLAALTSVGKNGLEASHIPLHLIDDSKDNWRLIGHVARANPLWKTLDDQSKVLTIFQGPQSYVSPSLYPTKKEHGKAVPTWNYAAVHIKGTLSIIHDAEWKLDMLNRLTNQMEADEPKPWQVADAPKDYTDKLLNAIIGIEISINHIEGKWKLSQNQPEQNQTGVMKGLSESDKLEANMMAELMKKQKN